MLICKMLIYSYKIDISFLKIKEIYTELAVIPWN